MHRLPLSSGRTHQPGRALNAMSALFAAALLLAQVVFAPPTHAQSAADPLVLAFYYAWYDESTWTYDRLSDLPAQSYASGDRAAMARHIEQAKAAGVDALLVAWYGPGGGNQTEPHLSALLEEAAARSFRIGVLFETDSPFFSGVGDVTGALQHLNAVHASQPAYLRVDGRPVIFFWRPSLYGVDAWRSIREQADPAHQNIWISEGVDTSLLSVFDGHHLYSNTWNPPADLTSVNAKYAGLVSSASQNLGATKLWVATVMPGYNDTRIRSNGFAHDRAGGAYFEQSWQAAINSGPNWIVINSFNEWPEGSYIEPSAAFGDQFVGLAAKWSSAFKGAPGPIISAASFAAPPAPSAAMPTPLPEVDSPTAFVDAALLNLRAGPGTEYDTLGQAVQGSPLSITGIDPAAPDWWQVAYATKSGASQTAWVYAPLVKTAGPLEQIPTVTAANPAVGQVGAPPFLFDPQSRPLTPFLSP